MTDHSPDRLDPAPWRDECQSYGWDERDLPSDRETLKRLQRLRRTTPELKGWTLGPVFTAWSAYSEFMLCGWLSVPDQRHQPFLDFLLLRQESGMPADATIREVDDWWAQVKHLKPTPSPAELPVPTTIALDGSESFEQLKSLVLARPANAPFTLVQLAFLLAQQHGRERRLSPAQVALQQAEYELALFGQQHRVQRTPPVSVQQQPPCIDPAQVDALIAAKEGEGT